MGVVKNEGGSVAQGWRRLWGPEEVAAAQQAIMRHPHFDGSAVTAFGFANSALQAVSRSPVPSGQMSDALDAARYRRLRVLGVAPCYTDHLKNGEVMRFTNLDEFVDKDIAWTPSRGEASAPSPGDTGSESNWLPVKKLMAEVDRLRGAIAEIQKATLEGRVCDDVAWFDSITTLHDFCDLVLNGSEPAICSVSSTDGRSGSDAA